MMSSSRPGRGLLWCLRAVHIVRQYPGTFFTMGLIVAIIQLIPLIGGLIILIAGPALLAGTVTAAHAADNGRKPAVRQLFAMFELPGKQGHALKLSLPLVITKFLAFVVAFTGLVRQLQQLGISVQALESHPDKLLAIMASGAMVPWFIAAVVIVLVGWQYTALAIPQVALQTIQAKEALKRGARSVRTSISAWLTVTVVIAITAFILITLLLMSHRLLIVQFGLTTFLYTLLGPLFYAAWLDTDLRNESENTEMPASTLQA